MLTYICRKCGEFSTMVVQARDLALRGELPLVYRLIVRKEVRECLFRNYKFVDHVELESYAENCLIEKCQMKRKFLPLYHDRVVMQMEVEIVKTRSRAAQIIYRELECKYTVAPGKRF